MRFVSIIIYKDALVLKGYICNRLLNTLQPEIKWTFSELSEIIVN